MNEDVPPTRYDAAVRERELAAQKARIVSEMAANERRQTQSQTTSRKQPLAPATTLPPPPKESKEKRGEKTPRQDKDVEPAGLFEKIGIVLQDAMLLAKQGSVYRPHRELRDRLEEAEYRLDTSYCPSKGVCCLLARLL